VWRGRTAEARRWRLFCTLMKATRVMTLTVQQDAAKLRPTVVQSKRESLFL
jgi:hypothetical protein